MVNCTLNRIVLSCCLSCILVSGVTFCLIGLIVGQQWNSRAIETLCKVVNSSIYLEVDQGVVYRAYITVRYEKNMTQTLFIESGKNVARLDEMLRAEYPIGVELACWYDKENSNTPVRLSLYSTGGWWFALAVFLVIGVFMVVYMGRCYREE